MSVCSPSPIRVGEVFADCAFGKTQPVQYLSERQIGEISFAPSALQKHRSEILSMLRGLSPEARDGGPLKTFTYDSNYQGWTAGNVQASIMLVALGVAAKLITYVTDVPGLEEIWYRLIAP